MPKATLIVIQQGRRSRKVKTSGGVTSIGRALDNTICLEGDSNVSRYHAEIEARGGEFWIVDLGSANGTTVSDEAVDVERLLQEGDLISVGGASVIEFHLRDVATPSPPPPEPAFSNATTNAPVADRTAPQSALLKPDLVGEVGAHDVMSDVMPDKPASTSRSSVPPSLIIAGVGGGLLLTAVVAVLVIGITGACSPSVRIVSPQTGSTVRGEVTIRVEAEGTKCIERVSYQLDGVEVASAETAPYDVVLDSQRLAAIGGGVHVLSVAVEDADGGKKIQPDTILLTFGHGSGKNSSSTSSQSTQQSNQTTQTTAAVSPPSRSDDVRSMAERLAGQITRKSGFVFDRELVEMIRARLVEYRVDGYTDRARRHRREINKAFRDQGLDPLLGYVLAMSRSKFNEETAGAGVGLWQIPLPVVQAQGYLAATESPASLKDSRRSAEIAAAYTKALLNTFESADDFMYAVACYGMPLNQVGEVRAQLATAAPDPMVRRDFLKVVKSGIIKDDQVDRVVRFFAAGIVCENPGAFGLRGEQPFSSLF
jgi:hypothetical protein